MKSYRVFAVIVAVALVLVAFGPGVVSAAPAPSPGASSSAWSGCWYHVKWGDTMSKIAASYGISAWELAEMNDLHHINRIWAGQWLRVPCYGLHPDRNYYYSSKYDCWGYSYYNAWYAKYIFICTD